MSKQSKGFTIIELLVVISIIALLAVIAIPQFIGSIEKSRESQNLAEINSVQKAAAIFYADHGYYPTLQGNQPTFGDPKNLKFSKDENGDGLYPKYLTTLPHFSYWYVDNKGLVYHTEKSLEDLSINGQYDEYVDSSGKYKVPYELSKLGNKMVYAAITDAFKGTKMHIEAPEFNNKPVAVITMTPEKGINTTTDIVWSYSDSTDLDGDAIVSAEWQLDDGDILTSMATGKITVAGNHTMKLRVKDSRGMWSDYVSKTFSVEKKIVNLTTASEPSNFMATAPSYPMYDVNVELYNDKRYVFYMDYLDYYSYKVFRICCTVRNEDGTELVAPVPLVSGVYINQVVKTFDAEISPSGDIYIAYKNSSKVAQIAKFDSNLNLVKTFNTGITMEANYCCSMTLALDDNNIYMVGGNYISYRSYRCIYKYDYNFNAISNKLYTTSDYVSGYNAYVDNGVLYVDELQMSTQNSGDYFNTIYTYNTSDLSSKSYRAVGDQNYAMTYGSFVKDKNGSLWYIGGDSPNRYTAITPKAFKIDTSNTDTLNFSSYIQLTSPGLSQCNAIPLDDGRVEIFYYSSGTIKHLYLQ